MPRANRRGESAFSDPLALPVATEEVHPRRRRAVERLFTVGGGERGEGRHEDDRGRRASSATGKAHQGVGCEHVGGLELAVRSDVIDSGTVVHNERHARAADGHAVIITQPEARFGEIGRYETHTRCGGLGDAHALERRPRKANESGARERWLGGDRLKQRGAEEARAARDQDRSARRADGR